MVDIEPRLEPDCDLTSTNTLALPSRAAWLLRAGTADEIVSGLRFAAARGWPVRVLGGGSNSLLPPSLPGLTIRPEIDGIAFDSGPDDGVEVEVGAGVSWHEFVTASVERGLWGVENLALIPGCTGAAPIQNIGAYGVELSDVLSWVEFIDRRDLSTHRVSAEACELGYRHSLFKGALADVAVITRLGLQLSRRATPRLDYGVLGERVSATPSVREIFEAVCAIRREKLPDPVTTPNAGSFFKNPVVDRAACDALLAETPDMPHYPLADGRAKLAAGWLIDQCGWKGARDGAFGVHDRQALVLVHFGGGTLAGLLAFAERIVVDVRQRFGVTLEREPGIAK
ncbi:UDP-N-acetylmuramate dehydrogenase [Salinicola rhizosphaerae]|uniref:UDP-N-acetylenolpyruvoylglucosamine reductase n=1 Tax=Salinicola rhizosphaerae TaxID=1443141 RepID=A0ABQ3DP99_9GAMM|nr:UDP-N-acetylmuramate dehydrogenase [Salinicola rhizosphaerae]GHB08070.1 UDP-N-acetylenolpyruvoylglucosamine reductase [Salinicola rhizosphaerae]